MTHFEASAFAENWTGLRDRIFVGRPQLRLQINQFPLGLSQLIPRLGQFLFQRFDSILAVGGGAGAAGAAWCSCRFQFVFLRFQRLHAALRFAQFELQDSTVFRRLFQILLQIAVLVRLIFPVCKIIQNVFFLLIH